MNNAFKAALTTLFRQKHDVPEGKSNYASKLICILNRVKHTFFMGSVLHFKGQFLKERKSKKIYIEVVSLRPAASVTGL